MPTQLTPTRRRRELYPCHYLRHQEYLDFKDYVMRWPWEWMITLTFESGITFFPAHEHFERWRLRLIHEERIRFAAYRITRSKNKRIHMHCLALGRNREGKTLRDVSADKWAARWPYHAKIEQVYDHAGAVDYVAKHMLGFLAAYAQTDSFDRTLLRQTMQVLNDGLDGLYNLIEPDGPPIGSPEDLLDGELDGISRN
jgi:hypothetical protein